MGCLGAGQGRRRMFEQAGPVCEVYEYDVKSICFL